MKRKTIILITLLCLIAIFVIGNFISHTFEFEKTGERTNSVEIPDSIKTIVLKDIYSLNPTSISRHCAKVTCD